MSNTVACDLTEPFWEVGGRRTREEAPARSRREKAPLDQAGRSEVPRVLGPESVLKEELL